MYVKHILTFLFEPCIHVFYGCFAKCNLSKNLDFQRDIFAINFDFFQILLPFYI